MAFIDSGLDIILYLYEGGGDVFCHANCMSAVLYVLDGFLKIAIFLKSHQEKNRNLFSQLPEEQSCLSAEAIRSCHTGIIGHFDTHSKGG